MGPRALVALAGAVLLGSLWLEWYAFDLEPWRSEAFPSQDGFQAVQGLVTIGGDAWTPTPWHLFAVLDIALAAIAFVAVIALLRPVALRAVRILGPLAAALIAFRILSPPDALLTAAAGAYVALAAAAVAGGGAWLATRRGPAA